MDTKPITYDYLRALSLRQWRTHPASPGEFDVWKLWEPLRPLFAARGLDMFHPRSPGSGDPGMVHPWGQSRRAYDGTYHLHKNDVCTASQHMKPTHCFARWGKNGRYVLIRLIGKDGQGIRELEILRYLSCRKLAWNGVNHCVRMQREISFDGMTFGVFPLLSEGMDFPQYHSLGEVVDSIRQVLEGLAHLHAHLVSHRDVGANNILINFVGSRRSSLDGGPTFRSGFPICYSFIDFEFSVAFDAHSSPGQRVIRGLPTAQLGLDHPEDYGRDIAPEMLSPEPHDPFKGDVFQMGKILLFEFHQSRSRWPGLIAILDRMAAEDYSARPSAADALRLSEAWLNTVPYETMGSRVPAPQYPAWDPYAHQADAQAAHVRREERALAKEKADSASPTVITALDRVLDPLLSTHEAGEDTWIRCVAS